MQTNKFSTQTGDSGLRTRLSDVQSRVSDVQNGVSELQSGVTGLHRRLSDVQTALSDCPKTCTSPPKGELLTFREFCRVRPHPQALHIRSLDTFCARTYCLHYGISTLTSPSSSNERRSSSFAPSKS